MEATITFCDLCNLDQDVEKFQPLEGQEEEEEPIGFFRGVFRGTFAQASYQEHWEERDFGHACQHCVKEEADQLAREAAEEEGSFVGFMPTPAMEVPEPKKKRKKNVGV